jgi:hypothetical protein
MAKEPVCTARGSRVAAKGDTRWHYCVVRFLSSVGALPGYSGQIVNARLSKTLRNLRCSGTSVAMS